MDLDIQIRRAPPFVPTNPILTSIEEAGMKVCECKSKSCNCKRIAKNGKSHSTFDISSMITQTSSHQIKYLLDNLNSIDVTASPQVTSSNPELTIGRRRRKKDPQSQGGTGNKPSSKRDNHTEEKKYPCPYCHDSFGYKHVLQNHVRTHTGEKPFKCPHPECGKRFTRDHHLKTHMRLHTGEKPFICKFCDKKFVQVANLRRHMRVHTGERPYTCDFASCQAKFSDSNQLNAHRVSHQELIVNEITDIKPLLKSCQTKFVDSNPETAHRLAHQEHRQHLAIDVKPLPVPFYINLPPFFPYLASQTSAQETPEDLSLKKKEPESPHSTLVR